VVLSFPIDWLHLQNQCRLHAIFHGNQRGDEGCADRYIRAYLKVVLFVSLFPANFAEKYGKLTRYFLHLAYDGTQYSGWQVQPAVVTVQSTLHQALGIFVKDLKAIIGCGRTDTGVHARDYYAHFDTRGDLPDEIVYRLNAVLPKDIAVFKCFAVDGQLHARFHATERTYKYYVHFKKDPFSNAYSAYHKQPLDIEAMNEAASHLVGEHDFSSFSRSKTQVSNNICHVFSAYWEPIPEGAVFHITANRYLRNMVRAIVGTMFLIGENKLKPLAIKEIIEARNRNAAGKSAFPQGLFLHQIIYPTLHGAGYRECF